MRRSPAVASAGNAASGVMLFPLPISPARVRNLFP
jgi:hypothetical protein